jgi:hypothetical protein
MADKERASHVGTLRGAISRGRSDLAFWMIENAIDVVDLKNGQVLRLTQTVSSRTISPAVLLGVCKQIVHELSGSTETVASTQLEGLAHTLLRTAIETRSQHGDVKPAPKALNRGRQVPLVVGNVEDIPDWVVQLTKTLWSNKDQLSNITGKKRVQLQVGAARVDVVRPMLDVQPAWIGVKDTIPTTGRVHDSKVPGRRKLRVKEADVLLMKLIREFRLDTFKERTWDDMAVDIQAWIERAMSLALASPTESKEGALYADDASLCVPSGSPEAGTMYLDPVVPI